jgi:hypothetical protein
MSTLIKYVLFYVKQQGNIEVYQDILKLLRRKRLLQLEEKIKLERAIEALSDENIRKQLTSEFGNRYNPAYAKDAIDRLKLEVNRLSKIVEGKNPYAEEKPGSGYGLLSGLGYGYGYGNDEGYGYFY